MNELIELGFSAKPHGIKGGFTFTLYNSDGESIQKGSEVTIIPKNSSSALPQKGKKMTIKSINYGPKVIVYFQDDLTRNDVESMIPFTVFMDKIDLPELDNDEFYIMDLIGADVFDHASGKKIGKLDNIYDNGMQDVFTISTENMGDLDLVNIELFIPVIDVENMKIEIVLPEVINERN